jgi:hypothetical protein
MARATVNPSSQIHPQINRSRIKPPDRPNRGANQRHGAPHLREGNSPERALAPRLGPLLPVVAFADGGELGSSSRRRRGEEKAGRGRGLAGGEEGRDGTGGGGPAGRRRAAGGWKRGAPASEEQTSGRRKAGRRAFFFFFFLFFWSEAGRSFSLFLTGSRSECVRAGTEPSP